MPIDPNILQSYIDPKMLIVIVVLWVVGSLLKISPIVPDKWIVWVLTMISIGAALFILGFNVQAVMQGVITVGISVYGHQLIKQSSK